MLLEVKTVEGAEWWLNPSQITAVRPEYKRVHLSGINYLMLDDESFAKLKAVVLPTKRTAKSTEPKSELNDLFDKLHKLTGGKGKAVFSLQREKKLGELLSKHRLTEELLIKAATNIGNDAFLQGENDNKKRYGDVDYLLRPDKAAKWSEDQEEKKKRGLF